MDFTLSPFVADFSWQLFKDSLAILVMITGFLIVLKWCLYLYLEWCAGDFRYWVGAVNDYLTDGVKKIGERMSARKYGEPQDKEGEHFKITSLEKRAAA